MNPNIPTRLQPPNQILQTLTRHRLPRLTRLCVVGVKEIRGLIRLETRLFGLFAVDLTAVLADIEDLWCGRGRDQRGRTDGGKEEGGRTLTCDRKKATKEEERLGVKERKIGERKRSEPGIRATVALKSSSVPFRKDG